MNFKLKVRIPGWCAGCPVPSDLYAQVSPGNLDDFKIHVNGSSVKVRPEKGYCAIGRDWRRGDVVEVSMQMPVRRIKAHEKVSYNK